MKRKFLAFYIFFGLTILLIACNVGASKGLTVTAIHDKVIMGKTTTRDLEKLFGKPKKVVNNPKEAYQLYRKWQDYEGGANYYLEDNTDYWETLHYSKTGDYSSDKFDSYYEYEGENLGIKSVYFFIVDNKVAFFQFNGGIINDKIAKKDPYLKKVY